MYATPAAPHGEVVLAVRPEHLVLGAAMDAAPATVLLVEPLGPESLVRLRLRSGDVVVARVPGEATCRIGDDVGVRVATGEGLCFRAGDGSRLT
jgi:hypothetical protein